MSNQPISKVVPDFDLLFNSLKLKLENSRAWADVLPTSVGTTIMDMFAGVGVTHQYYTDVNLREAFLPTAVRDSSIFSGTRMLGINIVRKSCAAFSATVTNNDVVTKFITPLDTFDVEGETAFSRQQYVIPPAQTITIDLYVGKPRSRTFDLGTYSDLALREFVLGVPGFVVSNTDMRVFTRDTSSGEMLEWTVTDKALFEHSPLERVFFSSTTRDGDVSLFFGDGEFGQLLLPSQELIVNYVETSGASGNRGLPGLVVKSDEDPLVKGETVTAIAGGADEKSALYYKTFAPVLFRAKRRLITDVDIRAAAIEFPGVADASVYGQKDIAPYDPSWRGLIRLCVLPEEEDTFGGANPNPKSAQWRQLLDVLGPRARVEIQTWNPSKKFVTVRARVALLSTAVEGGVRLSAMAAVLNLFKKKPGILGRRLSVSDISDAIRKIKGVDYVLIDSPDEEIVPSDMMEYVVLNGSPIIETFYTERKSS